MADDSPSPSRPASPPVVLHDRRFRRLYYDKRHHYLPDKVGDRNLVSSAGAGGPVKVTVGAATATASKVEDTADLSLAAGLPSFRIKRP